MAYAADTLRGLVMPAALWENAVFPARVNGYKPSLLDNILASGEFYWRFDGDGLMFETIYVDPHPEKRIVSIHFLKSGVSDADVRIHAYSVV